MGLIELNEFIPDLITALGQFLSTGIMFYIMSLLCFAIVLDILIKFLRR